MIYNKQNHQTHGSFHCVDGSANCEMQPANCEMQPAYWHRNESVLLRFSAMSWSLRVTLLEIDTKAISWIDQDVITKYTETPWLNERYD